MTASRNPVPFEQLNNLGKLHHMLRDPDQGPIYVVNNTDPRGMFVMTIADPASGRSKKLEFAKTWLPYNLCDLIPRNSIDYCMEIKETLRKGNLRIITEAEANVLLSSPRGQKEYDRLYKSAYSVGGISNSKSELLAASEVNRAQLSPLEQPNTPRDQLVLHPKMQAWEQRVVSGEIDGDSLVSELLNHGHEFTSEDCQYIMANQFPIEAKDYAQELIDAGKFAKRSLSTTSVAGAKKSDYAADWE